MKWKQTDRCVPGISVSVSVSVSPTWGTTGRRRTGLLGDALAASRFTGCHATDGVGKRFISERRNLQFHSVFTSTDAHDTYPGPVDNTLDQEGHRVARPAYGLHCLLVTSISEIGSIHLTEHIRKETLSLQGPVLSSWTVVQDVLDENAPHHLSIVQPAAHPSAPDDTDTQGFARRSEELHSEESTQARFSVSLQSSTVWSNERVASEHGASLSIGHVGRGLSVDGQDEIADTQTSVTADGSTVDDTADQHPQTIFHGAHGEETVSRHKKTELSDLTFEICFAKSPSSMQCPTSSWPMAVPPGCPIIGNISEEGPTNELWISRADENKYLLTLGVDDCRGLATPIWTVPRLAPFRAWTASSKLAFSRLVVLTYMSRSPGNSLPSCSATPLGTRERITITVLTGSNGS
ncbi:hypothetical protein EYF80_004488 [Liparis tanakae]|uniref:Uncharacterized protein n=1 Tax=Liparis tanakae TaxID=230148 RepID=A0A4Z2J656_9TELE|nr:hypothetical protein EYF80_004488 [Liparis tanakae]